jgi:hypothetical protein
MRFGERPRNPSVTGLSEPQYGWGAEPAGYISMIYGTLSRLQKRDVATLS